MKIGIISDIHGYPKQFEKAIRYFDKCDMVLCAGDLLYHGPRNPILEGYEPLKLAEDIKKLDIPMLIAKGNCDAEVDEMVLELPLISPVIVYEKDNIRFMVLHGHAQDDNKLFEIAVSYKINIMIMGHTHIKQCYKRGNTLFVNPGSISIPKDGSATIAIYENNEISFIDIETGKTVKPL